jgi:hypothetical protein
MMHMIYIRRNLGPRHDELVRIEDKIDAMNEVDARAVREERERLAFVLKFEAQDYLRIARQVAHKFEPLESFACVEEIFRLRAFQERFEAGGIGKFLLRCPKRN